MSDSTQDPQKAPDEEGKPSPQLIEHASRPRNVGRVMKPDALGKASRDCGDTIEFSFSVRGGQIHAIGFVPQSCVVTLACASMATTLAEGRTPIDARREVTAETIIESLGGVPKGEEHSAELVVKALRCALDEYIVTEREPWRRAYNTRY